MTPQELLKQLNDAQGASVVFWGGLPTQVKAKVSSDIERALEALQTDDNGNIKQTKANYATISKIRRLIGLAIKLNPWIRSKTEQFYRAFTSSANAIDEYVRTGLGGKVPEAFTEERRKQGLSLARRVMEGDGFESQVVDRFEDVVRQTVSTGGSRAGLRQQTQRMVYGTQGDLGVPGRYYSEASHNQFMEYEREYFQAAARDLELQWYLYEGPLKTTSRKFCERRAGEYYTAQEIRSWASQQWQGKHKNTTQSSIFTYLGGYNCRHVAIPVMPEAVPVSARRRAERLGFTTD